MKTNQILQGDTLEVLKTLPDKSINMLMTSPPYWALRDYGIEGQLGLEPTFKEYINNLCDILDEVKRVLRDDGTIWVNLGDTYGGTQGRGKGKGNENNQMIPMKMKGMDKSLVMIPQRFSIEMVNRGWTLRNVIIWHKRNCIPTSVSDRFTVDFEYLFFFSKKKKYYFKQQREKRKYSFDKEIQYNGKNPICTSKKVSKEDRNKIRNRGMTEGLKFDKQYLNPNGRNVRCVWSINPKPFADYICNKCSYYGKTKLVKAKKGYFGGEDEDKRTCPKCGNQINTSHFAIYPEELCEIPIKAGCLKDGIVLDPFFGSGTTGIVALKQNKKFIGIELNKEYIAISKNRLKPFLEQTKLP